MKNAPIIIYYGVCDEALARFIKKGQDGVDATIGQVWLKEISEEDGVAGSGSDQSDVSGNKGAVAEQTADRLIWVKPR